MLSVSLFARRTNACHVGMRHGFSGKNLWSLVEKALSIVLIAVGLPLASEGRASFASLMAGGLSPSGLGGFYSTPARYAENAYGVSYYWMDDVNEFSWNLSLDFGNTLYRVGAFISYRSMDSLYRNLYSESSFSWTWNQLNAGIGYGLGMEWEPGGEFWARHRFKCGVNYRWRQVLVAGMLSGFMDDGVTPAVGVHWMSDESISSFVECDFDYLYVGAGFRWKFLELWTSYRFPDFAVALQLSFRRNRYGGAYVRGFPHNSLGWNGIHVSRWIKPAGP